jgi:hypothetical protein
MFNRQPGVLPVLLSVCQGTDLGDQIAGVAIALVGLVVWIGIIWLIVGLERDAEERKTLGAILVASALIGATVMVTAHLGLGRLILLALAAALAIGIGGVVMSRQIGILRGIFAAVVGSLSLPIGAVLLLILHLSVGSGCLGEELG